MANRLAVHGDPADIAGYSAWIRQSASGALVQPDYCCPAVYDVQQSIEFHAGLRRSEKDNVRPGMVAITSDRCACYCSIVRMASWSEQ